MRLFTPDPYTSPSPSPSPNSSRRAYHLDCFAIHDAFSSTDDFSELQEAQQLEHLTRGGGESGEGRGHEGGGVRTGRTEKCIEIRCETTTTLRNDTGLGQIGHIGHVGATLVTHFLFLRSQGRSVEDSPKKDKRVGVGFT